MNYRPQQIIQGNRLKREAEESPSTFGTENGTSFNEPSVPLDQASQMRMAGPGGAFALKMQQDPEMLARVEQWSQLFAQSNPGMEFNQAKMMLMGGGVPQGEQQ